MSGTQKKCPIPAVTCTPVLINDAPNSFALFIEHAEGHETPGVTLYGVCTRWGMTDSAVQACATTYLRAARV